MFPRSAAFKRIEIKTKKAPAPTEPQLLYLHCSTLREAADETKSSSPSPPAPLQLRRLLCPGDCQLLVHS